MEKSIQNKELLQQVVDLLQQARQQVLRTVNSTMVYTYFEIGRLIVEEEQNGKERAEYGKQLLKGLSADLTMEFGKGFSVDNLQNMRKLFLAYSNYETVSSISKSKFLDINKKPETMSSISKNEKLDYKFAVSFMLSWSHYLFLISIEDLQERKFYEIESIKNSWSLRQLKRQYNSALFTRLSLSRDKEGILKLAKEGQIIEKPKDIIKDPYILEFLGLPELYQYSENDVA